MTGSDMVRFLQALLSEVRGEILFVWDNVQIHRSTVAKTFLAAHPRIRLLPLPPYAPELNPQEYVWASLKTKDLAHAYPDGMPALTRRIKSGKTRITKHPEILEGCLLASGLFKERAGNIC